MRFPWHEVKLKNISLEWNTLEKLLEYLKSFTWQFQYTSLHKRFDYKIYENSFVIKYL